MKSRNYRLYFIGQFFSQLGTWVQQVAMGWLAYHLGNSAFLLGLIGFSSQIPALLISPFAGVIADRFNRRKCLFLIQILALIQAILLGGLTLLHWINIPMIVLLSLFLGAITAIEMPVRLSFFSELIDDPNDLSNAMALNTTQYNAARMVGPAIAGLIISWVGEGWCFMLNGLSYLAIILGLCLIRLTPRHLGESQNSAWRNFYEGFVYVRQHRPIRAILMLVTVSSMAAVPYLVFLPVFAKDVFHGDAETLGALMGASGIGALIAAVTLASRNNTIGLERWPAYGLGLFGLGVLTFAYSSQYWLSMGLMVIMGFGLMIQLSSCNILVQSIVQDDMRGRTASFFGLAYLGMAPIGCLLMGYLSNRIGIANTLGLGGVACLMGSFWFIPQAVGILKAYCIKQQDEIPMTPEFEVQEESLVKPVI